MEGTTGPQLKRMLVRHWVQAAVRHRMDTQGTSRPLSPIAQQELEHFFQHDLTSNQRETLLAMPPEKMQRELRRLYFSQSGHVDATQTPSSDQPRRHPAGHHNKDGGRERDDGTTQRPSGSGI